MKPIALVCLSCLTASTAQAQSQTVSQASALSVDASIESVELVHDVLIDGSFLVITELHAVGEVVEISVQAAGRGASTVVHVSAAVAEKAALAVGGAIVVTATGAGFLLSAAGVAIAWLPSELARVHLHNREL